MSQLPADFRPSVTPRRLKFATCQLERDDRLVTTTAKAIFEAKGLSKVYRTGTSKFTLCAALTSSSMRANWWCCSALRGPGLGVVALAVLGGLIYALLPKPVPVDIEKISRGEMRVTVDEEGKTRIKEVYVVSAPIGGKILRGFLHVGDDVRAGQTEVAMMTPSAPPLLDLRTRSDLEAQVSAAEKAVRLAGSELTRAESETAMAELDLKRTSDLAKRGFAAERVLDRANTDARIRRAAVASAQSAVQVRQDELRSARAAARPRGAGDVRLADHHKGAGGWQGFACSRRERSACSAGYAANGDWRSQES